MEINLKNLSEQEQQQIRALIEKSNATTKEQNPQIGDLYFYISGNLFIESRYWQGDSRDFDRYISGNYYISMEQCHSAIEYQKIKTELIRIAHILNEGWNPVWYNNLESKYYMAYGGIAKKILLNVTTTMKTDSVYFKTAELAREAIQIIGEDRLIKYYFGVDSTND